MSETPRAAWPWATAVIALGALALGLWPEAERNLALQRERVLAGEFWRAWTGHLVHFGASHLLWNLAVFVPAGVWLERVAPRAARGFYVLAPLVIAAALFAFEPSLATYAGLSGVGAGLLALLALTQLARRPGRDRWWWWSVLALLVAKIAVEFVTREPAFARFDAAQVQSAPLAHAVGIACGVAVQVVARASRR